MHHSAAWYFFVFALFLWWAAGAANCVHILKHPEGKSAFYITCTWIALLSAIVLMLIVIGFVMLSLMEGHL